MSGKSRFELRLDGQRIDVRASSDVAEDRVAAETAAPAR